MCTCGWVARFRFVSIFVFLAIGSARQFGHDDDFEKMETTLSSRRSPETGLNDFAFPEDLSAEYEYKNTHVINDNQYKLSVAESNFFPKSFNRVHKRKHFFDLPLTLDKSIIKRDKVDSDSVARRATKRKETFSVHDYHEDDISTASVPEKFLPKTNTQVGKQNEANSLQISKTMANLLQMSGMKAHVKKADADFDGDTMDVETVAAYSVDNWVSTSLPLVAVTVAATFFFIVIVILLWLFFRCRTSEKETWVPATGGTGETWGVVVPTRGLGSPTPRVSRQICLYPCAYPDVNQASAVQPDVTVSAVGARAAQVSPPAGVCGVVARHDDALTALGGGGVESGNSDNDSGVTGVGTLTADSSGSSLPGTPVAGTPLPGTPLPGTPVLARPSPLHMLPTRLRRAKGLLERRGSSASLTIDIGGSTGGSRVPEPLTIVGSLPKESCTEEYLLSAGNRMSRKQLRDCVRNMRALYEEFWEIPMNHPDHILVAGSGLKNRYRTIIPIENTRVRLLPEVDGDPLTSYINANYIRGYAGEARAYIATQGPMTNTVEDLWRMVWQERTPVIVMITKLAEKNRIKCEPYIPTASAFYGDVEVCVNSTAERDGYVVRALTVTRGGVQRPLLHYWYTAWPDHKTPDTARQLLALTLDVDQRRVACRDGGGAAGPVLVHCSAGIGRTGCFIATSIGLQQLREEMMVDTLGIVCAMRLDRGGMVQTNEQYGFVHQALCLYEKELSRHVTIDTDSSFSHSN